MTGFTGRPRRVFIVHGESSESKALADLITKETGIETTIPQFGEEYTLRAAEPEYVGITEPLTVPLDRRQQLLLTINRLEQKLASLKAGLLAEEYEDEELKALDEALQELEERVS